MPQRARSKSKKCVRVMVGKAPNSKHQAPENLQNRKRGAGRKGGEWHPAGVQGVFWGCFPVVSSLCSSTTGYWLATLRVEEGGRWFLKWLNARGAAGGCGVANRWGAGRFFGGRFPVVAAPAAFATSFGGPATTGYGRANLRVEAGGQCLAGLRGWRRGRL